MIERGVGTVGLRYSPKKVVVLPLAQSFRYTAMGIYFT